MARYNTFKYGDGTKYGATATNNLLWAVQVDWDGDGAFDGTNEAPYVTAMSIERGRDRFLDFGSGRVAFPNVGRATLVLKNYDGRYDAWNVLSPLYGFLEPGKFVRIYVKYDGIIYPRFAGVLKDIRATGSNNEYVQMDVEDGLQWLYDNEIDIDVQSSVRVDAAIAQILTQAAWPALWGSDLDISSDTMTYWWAEGSAAGQIADLAQTGVGYFATAANGKAIYRNRSSVDNSGVSLTDENTLKQVIVPQPWEYYKNIVRVKFAPRVQQSTGTVWKLDTVPQLLAGESLTLFCDYSYGAEVRVPVLNAAVGTYTANSASDGSGTNLTAQVTVSLTDFGTNGKVVITNTGVNSPYITSVTITGNAIVLQNPGAIQVETGDYASKPRRFTLDLPWQQDINAATDIANILSQFLSTISPYPTVQVEARPDIQFLPDLYNTVEYSSARLGISDSFRVGKIIEEWVSENGQTVRTTFKLEPYISGIAAWEFDVTNFGAVGAGGTTFG